jgi:hypothetical protein
MGAADIVGGKLAEALTLVHKNEEHHYAAEVYRLKGELLLQQAVGGAATRTTVMATSVVAETEWGRTTHASPLQIEAESCFRQPLEIARHQHAKSFELRAVMSLSRL